VQGPCISSHATVSKKSRWINFNQPTLSTRPTQRFSNLKTSQSTTKTEYKSHASISKGQGGILRDGYPPTAPTERRLKSTRVRRKESGPKALENGQILRTVSVTKDSGGTDDLTDMVDTWNDQEWFTKATLSTGRHLDTGLFGGTMGHIIRGMSERV
jgi:hypothetical protein